MKYSNIINVKDSLFKYSTTPDTPTSGYVSLYFKEDNKLYKKTSAGTETEIGGGGGANTFLSNLDNPTAINQHLSFAITGSTHFINATNQTSNDTDGDALNISAAKAKGNAAGGSLTLSPGNADEVGTGGSTYIYSGNGGSTSGNTGNIWIEVANATVGSGGELKLKAGNSNSGSGGNVTLVPGNSSTSKGSVRIINPATSTAAYFNTDLLTGSDRTYTLQDISGTFAIIASEELYLPYTLKLPQNGNLGNTTSISAGNYSAYYRELSITNSVTNKVEYVNFTQRPNGDSPTLTDVLTFTVDGWVAQPSPGLPAGTDGQVLQYNAGWTGVTTMLDSEGTSKFSLEGLSGYSASVNFFNNTLMNVSYVTGFDWVSTNTGTGMWIQDGVTPKGIIYSELTTWTPTIDWMQRILYGDDGSTQCLHWGLMTGASERGIATQGYILDFASVTKSIDPNNRILYYSSGSEIALNWAEYIYMIPMVGFGSTANRVYIATAGDTNEGSIYAFDKKIELNSAKLQAFDGLLYRTMLDWSNTLDGGVKINPDKTYKATLGDESNTRSAYFTDGTRYAEISNGTYASHFGDTVFDVAICSSTYGAVYATDSTSSLEARLVDKTNDRAGYFTDGARIVTICENTNLYGFTAIDSDYTVRLVDNANNYAAYFSDTGGTNQIQIANGTYGVQATRSGAYIGYLGSANWAVRGEDTSATHLGMLCDATYGGVFQYGSVTVNLASSTTAGYFTDGTRSVDICDGVRAGYFVSGTNSVTIANGPTYGGAIEVIGEADFFNSGHTGEIYLGGGSYPLHSIKGSANAAGYFTDGSNNIYLGYGTDALSASNGTVFASVVSGSVAGSFSDGTRTVQMANGSYAVEATSGNIKGAFSSSDGSAGATSGGAIPVYNDGATSGQLTSITIKDGIITAYTVIP